MEIVAFVLSIHFQISKPETKKLTFKIYTNKKIFKKKLKYKLD